MFYLVLNTKQKKRLKLIFKPKIQFRYLNIDIQDSTLINSSLYKLSFEKQFNNKYKTITIVKNASVRINNLKLMKEGIIIGKY